MKRYRRNPTRRSGSKKSGISDGTKLALVVGGLAAVAGIGYLVYQSQSSSSTTTAGGAGGSTTGSGVTTLGPGGSSGAIGPAASSTTMQPTAGVTDTSPTDYEAGAGSDAPLVPTATG